MTFTILLALTGLTLSGVAIYYSVIGLTAIFSAAFWPIVVMGTSLEVSKLVAASWLKANWSRIPFLMKTYMMIAVFILMVITSMGIFGFLSKAHSDQNLVSGDVQSKIAIYDEKIKTAKENIEANRKQLKQMDEAVDQVMARSTSEEGATKANNIRRSQQRDRTALAKDIEANQKLIASLNDEAAPIRAEVRKVEAEVGPIKYIAAFIYGDNPDENILERAVTWVIVTIIIVFDPLAVLMLLASQMTWQWRKEEEEGDSPLGPNIVGAPTVTDASNEPQYEQDDGPLTENQITQLKTLSAEDVTWPFPTYEEITPKEQSNADNNNGSSNVVDNDKRDDIGDGEHPTVVDTTPSGSDQGATDDTAVLNDVDAWNKMIEAAEAEIAKEKKRQIPEGPEFPENPTVGDEFRKTGDEETREYIFNGDQWVNSATSDPTALAQIHEEAEAKKKTYMIKDEKGTVLVKTVEDTSKTQNKQN